MHIIYTNPVDGIERARATFEEARLLLIALEAQGVDPTSRRMSSTPSPAACHSW